MYITAVMTLVPYFFLELFFTVTLILAFTFPSTVVMVMVALPFFFALITPLEETVATFLLEDLNFTFLFTAFAG